METFCQRDVKNGACMCVNCKEGKLTKAQYAMRIRNICCQTQMPRVKGSLAPIVPTASCTNTGHGLKYEEKTPHKAIFRKEFDVQKNYNRYFTDEEVPSDLEYFNLMMNGSSGDPRILPAVVDTLKYVRKIYHEMLTETRTKAWSFFENERRSIGSKSSDSLSSDGQSSNGEFVNENRLKTASDILRMRKHEARESYNRHGLDVNTSRWKQRIRVENVTGRRKHEWTDGEPGVDCDSDPVDDKSITETKTAALHDAAMRGNVEKVMRLILDWCDVNALNKDGWPAFEGAMNNSKFRCALFLIEAGTDMKRYTTKKVEQYEKALSKVRSYTQFIKTAL